MSRTMMDYHEASEYLGLSKGTPLLNGLSKGDPTRSAWAEAGPISPCGSRRVGSGSSYGAPRSPVRATFIEDQHDTALGPLQAFSDPDGVRMDGIRHDVRRS